MTKTTLPTKIITRSFQLLTCVTFIVSTIQTVFSHGTVTNPPSRVWICFQEDPQNPDSPACEASIIGWGPQAFYDWNEVARMDANGMHRSIIADGNLASAGRPDKYGGLDQVRNDWVSTPVSPGPYTITWTITAPHETKYYDVYITKEGWTPDQPLTWDSLELLVRTDPRPSAVTDNIDIVLPKRTGKHVIYSVWQRSLSEEAFYSTSDVDFGTAPETNKAPVGAFISTAGRCGGADVYFDAGESFDPNGDSLTYSWDFGDGTTGEGVTVSHRYSNLEDATVTLTVSDGTFSNGVVETISLIADPNCIQPACPYDTSIAKALPTLNTSYENVHILGNNGPNLEHVTKLTVDWNFINNGLYGFTFNLDREPYFIDMSGATQNFNQPNPKISLKDTGITGLDGTYAVTMDEGNFVMVSDDNYTLYFSNSTTVPNCRTLSIGEENIQRTSFAMFPNPATTSFSVQNKTDLRGSTITITDLSGKEVKSLSVNKSTQNMTINISGINSGLYLVRILYPQSGISTSLKLLVR